ncbi:MAG: hypothetical protein JNM10_03035 [Planctomycetia bacterium]|nr:hypothetical protein [Planctomycetia bacterium]
MTWTCARCHRAIDAGLDVCWACGTSRDGVVDPTFEPVEATPSDGGPALADLPLVPPVIASEPVDAAPSATGATADATSAPEARAEALERAAAARSDVLPRCERCHADLVYRGQRILLALDASDDDDDRVGVYVCTACGHVELFLAP